MFIYIFILHLFNFLNYKPLFLTTWLVVSIVDFYLLHRIMDNIIFFIEKLLDLFIKNNQLNNTH